MTVKILKRLFACKYIKECPLYQKDGFSCNNLGEEGYCGKYKELDRIQKMT